MHRSEGVHLCACIHICLWRCSTAHFQVICHGTKSTPKNILKMDNPDDRRKDLHNWKSGAKWREQQKPVSPSTWAFWSFAGLGVLHFVVGGFGRPVIVCNPPPSQLIALLLSFLCSRANDPESHTCVASTISRALCSLFVHQISLPRALSRRSFFLISFEWTYFNKDAQNTRVRYNRFLFLKEVVC